MRQRTVPVNGCCWCSCWAVQCLRTWASNWCHGCLSERWVFHRQNNFDSIHSFHPLNRRFIRQLCVAQLLAYRVHWATWLVSYQINFSSAHRTQSHCPVHFGCIQVCRRSVAWYCISYYLKQRTKVCWKSKAISIKANANIFGKDGGRKVWMSLVVSWLVIFLNKFTQ